LKTVAKLNHSQISKYLINFTLNYLVRAAAVVSAERGSTIAKKCAKFFHFCAIWSIELSAAQAGQFCAIFCVRRILASLVLSHTVEVCQLVSVGISANRIMCCTLNTIPSTQSLLNKCRLPLGLLLHPFRDLSVS